MGCDCSEHLDGIRDSLAKPGKPAVSETIAKDGPIDETLYGKELKGSAASEAANGDQVSDNDGPGKHGAIGSLRFCNWAAPEYGPIGEGFWDNAFRAAALAIAIANGVAQSKIADMQQDLADSYYDMANSKWERFRDHFIPLEKKLLKEVLGTDPKEMDCGKDRERADVWVGRAYGAMRGWAGRVARQLRVCMDISDKRRLDRAEKLALADTANYNYVDDRWFCDYSNDKRWNRRSSVLNLGRNLGSEALKYGDVARGLLNTISGQVEQAAQGLVSALGYYGARLDTYYPSSYLGQSQGNLANIGHSIGYGSQQSLGFPGAMGAV